VCAWKTYETDTSGAVDLWPSGGLTNPHPIPKEKGKIA
jgi:hypothetical protein